MIQICTGGARLTPLRMITDDRYHTHILALNSMGGARLTPLSIITDDRYHTHILSLNSMGGARLTPLSMITGGIRYIYLYL